MGNTKRSGFTLIELLIVIGIIGLMAAALLPSIISGRGKANIAADAANLRWHFQYLDQLRTEHKMPKQGGHKLVLASWYRKLVEHSEQSFKRYWIPGLAEEDPRYKELLEQGLDKIWQNEQSVTSLDTHYAGRGTRNFLGMMSEKEALMADDNEISNSFTNGSINVLYGGGFVKELLADPDLLKYGWKIEDGKPFEVGPQSPHPDLAKLEK